MSEVSILWVDDEIELLKPHILFLEQKGYKVDTVNNGGDAIDLVGETQYDIIFLDENMPGLSGLETLTKIKDIRDQVPVVMITKSEEEHIMEDAIGQKIADYLIKPVNPNQILLSVKKILDHSRLVSEKTNLSYQQEFRQIAMELNEVNDHSEWVSLYKKLVRWEMDLDQLQDNSMQEVLRMQKSEANGLFFKYVKKNYESWITGSEDRPLTSNRLLKEKIFPLCSDGTPVVFVLIDNLRWDQWKLIQGMLKSYKLVKEEAFYSILPTATHYARNCLFAGLMPSEIEKQFPKYWAGENDEGSKNKFEGELLIENIAREKLDIKSQYHKITKLNAGKKLVEQASNLLNTNLSVVVYNFVDMLSHAKTEMEVIRELADDDKAYRDLTKTWFSNSPLFELLEKLAKEKVKVVITTDHGTVNVNNPVKVVGDRNTNTNLRYKTGRQLSYDAKDVYEVKNPLDVKLPKETMSSSFIFAKEDEFFAYPNNYNHYVNYYRNTFQHGGISLEEMIVPLAILEPK